MRKKHNYEDRLKYMKMLEGGYSINFIRMNYGIDDRLQTCLWEKYQVEGPTALLKKKNCARINDVGLDS